MPRFSSRLWALLLSALLLHIAFAQSFTAIRREDGSVSTTASFPSGSQPSPTASTGAQVSGSSSSSAPTAVTMLSAANQTSTSASPTVTGGGGGLNNSTFFNATIPEGQLPIAPQLTPAWGVAGFIMLVTGAVYAMVGIKNRWIHTFFSTAYMTALGIAVLIVYVMNVPVSNSLQGAYVVAVVMSGCAVGAAAMFFKELTEGFGCALGGFCISMWLLCLVPGGLLQAVPSKAVFIASFTIVGFASYFSRWTRDWSLIILVAFGGSTITVLGIDCFSRAGLKEFWAWIWAVNENLFPLGADTYPVTKGIRVETAAIIIIFLMGIISQINLWRIVREKRFKRAAELAADQRNLELEEEDVGRQIEESNARERRQWERIYGDGITDSATESHITDLGDAGSEKRLRPSYAGFKQQSTAEVIDMGDVSESDVSGHGLMATEEAEDGKVTVRVAADDVPEALTDASGELLEGKTEARNAVATHERDWGKTTSGKRVSQTQTMTEAPEVVPLPFTVPPEANERSEDDRSSIATFADDAEISAAAASQSRRSPVKVVPYSSGPRLQNSSQQPEGIKALISGTLEDEDRSDEMAGQKQDQVKDDQESLAATMDDESVSGKDAHSTVEDDKSGDQDNESDARPKHDVNDVESANGPVPAAIAPANSLDAAQQPTATEAQASVTKPVLHDAVADSQPQSSGDVHPLEASEKAKSIVSASSTPASLTQHRLPRSMSKVALSYRTNEWAKHLSNAERPEPDELRVSASVKGKKSSNVLEAEAAAPVNVEELKQTAEDGGPPPVIRRTSSQASDLLARRSSTRTSSRQDMRSIANVAVATAAAGKESPVDPSPTSQMAPTSRKSSAALRHSSSNFKPIAEEQADLPAKHIAAEEQGPEPQRKLARLSSLMTLDTAMSQSPATTLNRSPVPGVVSYSSPQTLLGQREKFLKSKSHASLISSSPEPIYAAGPGSDAGSLHNYPMYAAALNVADADEVPLSQRKEMIRQSSMMSLTRSPSQLAMAPARPLATAESSENLTFNSHQPKRSSTAASFAQREAQLASFRQSIQHDLRSGTPIMMSPTRESPFSPSSMLGNGGRETEIQRNIEMQRNVLMGQKEAETQRKEMERRERESADRAFDERMRTGDMLEAHREAMRRLQKSAR